MKRAGFALLVEMLFSCSPAHHANSDRAVHSTFTQVVRPARLLRSFHDASSMSIDQFRNIYVAEFSSNVIIKLSPAGDSLRSVSGTGTGHDQFNGPIGIDARLTNTIFIADNFNHRVEQYTKDLTYVSTLYTRENSDPSKRFGYPKAVAPDDAGNIYVADGENKRIIKARSDYSIERTIGGYAEATRPEGILTNPIAVAVDQDEHLIVLDNGGASLVTFDKLGNELARVELGNGAQNVTAWNDTIVAVAPGLPGLRLFRGSKLEEQPAWGIDDVMNLLGTDPILAIASRSGSIVLLTRHGLYSCSLGPRTVGDPTIIRN